MKLTSFFFLLFFLSNCFNISNDGPDVISANSANERFRKVLISKLLPFTEPSLSYRLLQRRTTKTPSSGCLRNSYYLTSAVDYCEKALTINNGKTIEEVLTQHLFILTFVCELKRISFFGHEKPLQGEINFCSATGQNQDESK